MFIGYDGEASGGVDSTTSSGRYLKMAPEKTEALLVMDRRSFKYPKIVLGEHGIEWLIQSWSLRASLQ